MGCFKGGGKIEVVSKDIFRELRGRGRLTDWQEDME